MVRLIKIELFGHNDLKCVGRRQSEAFNPKNAMPTIKHCGGTTNITIFSGLVLLELELYRSKLNNEGGLPPNSSG